jgi:selenocysteine lyase/cysteine desulfurase
MFLNKILAGLFGTRNGHNEESASISLALLRSHIIGADHVIETPYGERLLTYADYTASGRSVDFIEDYIKEILCLYANTHTEDDTTGRTMSQLFHQAEVMIRDAVGADERDCILTCGDGATLAIYRLQQILGIALPPATSKRIDDQLQKSLDSETYEALIVEMDQSKPVVFVGPYEHHSNEISWRSSHATVVEVELDKDGGIDLDHLEALLKDEKYKNRQRIGSFSAASNVTGIKSPVHDIACLLHKHNAIACFDYAASAPYVDINMNPKGYKDGEDPSLDAIFISPHKFLGGPGAAGLLVFKKSLYDGSLAPSVSGGGTVAYVNKKEQDFFDEIELREHAGTPGILQALRAALVFALKNVISTTAIAAREHTALQDAFTRWHKHPNIEILGNPNPDKRVGIVSFNINTESGAVLHPKFVTTLLDDLFGLQTRAGCACAGPYGHRLLGIGNTLSDKFRDAIAGGTHGLKPGWCRLGFHYAMDEAEVDFIIRTVEFVADHGEYFVGQYDFDLESGTWSHKKTCCRDASLCIMTAMKSKNQASGKLTLEQRRTLYDSYLRDAVAEAKNAQAQNIPLDVILDGTLGELQFFVLSRDTLVT